MAKIPVALQLFSVRKECEQDLPKVLQAVAKMGYEGVEFAGYYNRSAQELRKMLDDLGLKVAGSHIGLDKLMGDELKRTVEFNKILGNPYLIVPWIPDERRNSKAAWLQTAQLFNELADKLAAEGMFVGYHNHHIEFTPMEGQTPWDIFFGATKPSVIMQLDTGNAMHGGADPVPYLERYPGRAVTIHIKEFCKANPAALVGEGDVRWKDVIRLCSGPAGTKWYIIEHEVPNVPSLECVEKCLVNFRRMLEETKAVPAATKKAPKGKAKKKPAKKPKAKSAKKPAKKPAKKRR